MNMNRAYSLLEIKSVDEDLRVIEGIATTPTTDRMGDVVEPKGAEFKLPIPLLWQHNSGEPIGNVISAQVTSAGIKIKAQIAKGVLPEIDRAWALIKAGLVRGLSIGFRGIETSRIDTGMKFLKWEWMELSAVTIPANSEASITTIKSIDQAMRAASGAKQGGVVRLDPSPGVSGQANQPAKSGLFYTPKGTEVNITEQLLAFDTKKKAANERMEALMTKAAEEGRTFDEHEKEEYDGLQVEAKGIDEHVVRLQAHEKAMIAKAAAVTPNAGRGEGAVDIPGTGYISVKRNLPKATAFTRYAMALALSKGNLTQAERIAATYCKDTPEVGLVLKAATDAGTTTDTTWAAPLVQYQDMVSEFIEQLRAEVVIGRLNQVRRVPFNIRIPRQTSGTTGTFVGEGAPAPVRELAFDNITLQWAKASTIVVITAELAKFGNPSAEALVRSDLIAGMAEYLDKRLLDPAYAGVANVSPASLTNGVTPTQASGATLAALDKDIRTTMTVFADANLGLSSGVWVMSASLAIRLSMLRTNQDSKAFPELNVNGGTFYGLPVIVSNNVAPSGSPGDQHLILINQREVLLADEGQMMLDASAEASVQMNDAPSAGAQSLVSLWQNGLVGLKVDKWINWTKRRSQAVQFIDKAQSYAS